MANLLVTSYVNASMSANATAIIVFARSASAECSHKFISTSAYKNRLLFELFNNRVRAIVKKTRLPHYTFDETQQKGLTFAEKITHSIESVFSLGYQNLIVIGNDCPAMNMSLLKEVIVAVEAGKNVFGPDNRGGVYLMGLQKSSYYTDIFKNLRWQTSFLFRDIVNMYQVNDVRVLPKLKDVNTRYDALISISDIRLSETLRAFLMACLTLFIKIKRIFLLHFSIYDSFQCRPLRAPPFFG